MSIKKQRAVVELVKKFEGSLAQNWIRNCISDAEHGEWGLAFENLCTQLYEEFVVISDNEYEDIIVVGRSMGLPETKWNFLDPKCEHL